MKFLCDEMLKGLARWLCIAGHDAEMEPDGTPDRRLIERAAADDRLLLTRDRTLLQIRDAPRVVVLLAGNDIESCVRELDRRLHIDWLHRPFSRCSRCNTPLVEAVGAPEFSWPTDIRQAYKCEVCGQYYWQGGHVERMLRRLQRWQQWSDSRSDGSSR